MARGCKYPTRAYISAPHAKQKGGNKRRRQKGGILPILPLLAAGVKFALPALASGAITAGGAAITNRIINRKRKRKTY